jgi:hypothetical protein
MENCDHDDTPCNKNGGPRDGDKESSGDNDDKGGEEENEEAEEGVRALASWSRGSDVHGNRGKV